MKTIRDYLFELDITELVDTIFEEYGEKLYDLYYYNNPIGYNDSYIRYDDAVRELTVFEYAQAKRKELYDYIRYLQDLEINESPNLKTGVIYAFGEFEKDYFDRWQVRLLFLEDLLTDPDNCKNRSFAAVPFSEVLMFRVADNKFTQDVIYSVIARVLHVASHTGYRQENREKYLKKVKDSGGDYEPYMPINEWSRCSFFDDPTHIFHAILSKVFKRNEPVSVIEKRVPRKLKKLYPSMGMAISLYTFHGYARLAKRSRVWLIKEGDKTDLVYNRLIRKPFIVTWTELREKHGSKPVYLEQCLRFLRIRTEDRTLELVLSNRYKQESEKLSEVLGLKDFEAVKQEKKDAKQLEKEQKRKRKKMKFGEA